MAARQVISTHVPPIPNRNTPRHSNSNTKGQKRRTYSVLKQWPGFQEELAQLREALDDSEQRYKGITLPGAAGRTSFEFAADVRGPMGFICLIPNDVAEHMGLCTELAGGGSNRSVSLSCPSRAVGPMGAARG